MLNYKVISIYILNAILTLASFCVFPPNLEFNLPVFITGMILIVLVDTILERVRKIKNKERKKSIFMQFVDDCILTAIFEEAIFRNLLLLLLIQYVNLSVECSVLISSIAFALCHINAIFEDNSFHPIELIDRFIAGMIFGFGFVYSNNSLLMAGLLHFMTNSWLYLLGILKWVLKKVLLSGFKK